MIEQNVITKQPMLPGEGTPYICVLHMIVAFIRGTNCDFRGCGRQHFKQSRSSLFSCQESQTREPLLAGKSKSILSNFSFLKCTPFL